LTGAAAVAKGRQAIDLLYRYQIRFDTLTTITPANVHRVEELYTFLTQELRPAVVRFQPCVEHKDHQTVAPQHWPADTLLPVGQGQR
jgi:serine-type anaerobic sulfatase-maturating enzyme